MDGMVDTLRWDVAPTSQHTLKTAIACVGIGLHSGVRVHVRLVPAAADTGIVFTRTDLGRSVPARHELVAATRLCTQLRLPDEPDVSVGTIEHLMSALSACGIDNAAIELDGPELPIFDGSAAPWLFLLDCAGRAPQGAPRASIEVMRTIRVESGLAWAELRPASVGGLDFVLSIDFAAEAIGRQAFTLRATETGFRADIAQARTFTQAQEIDAMRDAGLARGGSLENAVVVDGPRVLNPEGLRFPDEFVRHKLQDAWGDLALAGAPLRGRFVAHRTGHALNNQLLRALFADDAAWRLTSESWVRAAA